MSLVPYGLARPFLFGLDPEAAHDLTLDSIARLQNTPAMCLWQQRRVDDPVTVAGLRHPNLVRTLGVVAAGELDGVASIPQVLEIDALDDAPRVDVEARDHPDGNSHDVTLGVLSGR